MSRDINLDFDTKTAMTAVAGARKFRKVLSDAKKDGAKVDRKTDDITGGTAQAAQNSEKAAADSIHSMNEKSERDADV